MGNAPSSIVYALAAPSPERAPIRTDGPVKSYQRGKIEAMTRLALFLGLTVGKLSGVDPLIHGHFRDRGHGLAATGGDQESRFVALM